MLIQAFDTVLITATFTQEEWSLFRGCAYLKISPDHTPVNDDGSMNENVISLVRSLDHYSTPTIWNPAAGLSQRAVVSEHSQNSLHLRQMLGGKNYTAREMLVDQDKNWDRFNESEFTRHIPSAMEYLDIKPKNRKERTLFSSSSDEESALNDDANEVIESMASRATNKRASAHRQGGRST